MCSEYMYTNKLVKQTLCRLNVSTHKEISGKFAMDSAVEAGDGAGLRMNVRSEKCVGADGGCMRVYVCIEIVEC